MFGFFHTQPSGGLINLEVWRQTGEGTYNNWGDIDESAPPPPIPALAGRRKVQVVENCVFEPRTTRINNSDDGVDGSTTTAVTVYLSDPTIDIQLGDFFAFSPHRGKLEAWKLDGEGTINNYVSPFSGVVGGRELFLARVRRLK